MKMTGNTILITGGGSGIGRRLAEEFHQRGNIVIIAGRRPDRLHAVAAANPGMIAVELDVTDPADILAVTEALLAAHPALNVLINNAGIMLVDDVAGPVDESLLVATIDTNLGGPIRMAAALAGHLKTRTDAVIVNVTSILGFVPLVPTAIYSATKAALHSYTQSQRYAFRSSGIQVVELAPPWVRTELLNSTEEERAMPLDAFIDAALAQLASGVDEVLVGDAVAMRANPGPGEAALITVFNDQVASGPPLG